MEIEFYDPDAGEYTGDFVCHFYFPEQEVNLTIWKLTHERRCLSRAGTESCSLFGIPDENLFFVALQSEPHNFRSVYLRFMGNPKGALHVPKERKGFKIVKINSNILLSSIRKMHLENPDCSFLLR